MHLSLLRNRRAYNTIHSAIPMPEVTDSLVDFEPVQHA
jgi:hypothetical protein